MKGVVGGAGVVQCLCCTYPSLSLPLPLTSLPSGSRLSPTWSSTVMKKDALCVRACVCVCLPDCLPTHMCVTCVVMNKDVLCVELVVNHWQCWQLTDKQIDPRPPRERCLALAHLSHTHARTHICMYCPHIERLRKGWPKRFSSGASTTSHVNICESYKSTQRVWGKKEPSENEKQTAGLTTSATAP